MHIMSKYWYENYILSKYTSFNLKTRILIQIKSKFRMCTWIMDILATDCFAREHIKVVVLVDSFQNIWDEFKCTWKILLMKRA